MSTALFCSFALFTACSDKRGNGGGKLDGDFSTEATDEEVAEALTKFQNAVEGNTIVGDTEADDWSFGFESDADISFSMIGVEAGAGEGAQSDANLNIDLDVGYKLIIGNSAVSGAGDLSVSVDLSDVKHVLSHQVLYAAFYRVEIAKENRALRGFLRIPVSDIDRYAVPRLIHLYLERLERGETKEEGAV